MGLMWGSSRRSEITTFLKMLQAQAHQHIQPRHIYRAIYVWCVVSLLTRRAGPQASVGVAWWVVAWVCSWQASVGDAWWVTALPGPTFWLLPLFAQKLTRLTSSGWSPSLVQTLAAVPGDHFAEGAAFGSNVMVCCLMDRGLGGIEKLYR